MLKGEPVAIPIQCIEPKVCYRDINGREREIVAEVRKHVSETFAPHLWPGHTHSAPPDDAKVRFIGDFQLRPDRWAPCPCCSPSHGKYWKQGMIAHFPDEGVIRLMGWKCFSRINASAQDAYEEYLTREKQRQLTDFLLRNLHLIPKARQAIAKALPIAEAFDSLRRRLGTLLRKQGIELEKHTRGGELMRHDQSGNISRYSSIEGHTFLTGGRSVAKRLTKADEALGLIDLGRDYPAKVEMLSDAQRIQLAGTFQRALAGAREALADLEEMRRFLATKTLNTLRSWAALDECPCHLAILRSDDNLWIGRSVGDCEKVPVPITIFETLMPIPGIGEDRTPSAERAVAAE